MNVAQQPHAATGEIDKVHAPDSIAGFGVSAHAPHEWRPVADAGRWATLRSTTRSSESSHCSTR
jgi:hypothetical protein